MIENTTKDDQARARALVFISIATIVTVSLLVSSGEWFAAAAFVVGYVLSTGFTKFSQPRSRMSMKTMQDTTVTTVGYGNGVVRVRVTTLGVRADFCPNDSVEETNLLTHVFDLESTAGKTPPGAIN